MQDFQLENHQKTFGVELCWTCSGSLSDPQAPLAANSGKGKRNGGEGNGTEGNGDMEGQGMQKRRGKGSKRKGRNWMDVIHWKWRCGGNVLSVVVMRSIQSFSCYYDPIPPSGRRL